MRFALLPVSAAALLSLTACLPLGLVGDAFERATGGAPVATHTSAPRSYAELPPEIGFQTSGELATVSKIGFTGSMSTAGVLALPGDGQPGEAVFEFTDEGCVLVLRQRSDSDVGLVFSADDSMNSAEVLVTYLGDIAPEDALTVSWRVNGDASVLAAIAAIVIDNEGRRVIAIARGIGELGEFFYSEFSCNSGVYTETVFAEIVAPYISIEMLR